MKRRDFLTLVGATAASWPRSVRAQKLPMVGYLTTVSSAAGSEFAEAFRRGLKETQATAGRGVRFEYRFANGQIGKLPSLAKELVDLNVDLIAAMGGSRSALAARQVTSTVPIVFTMGDADPVQLGIVSNLARPRGNATGISLLGGTLAAKHLELLRELIPSAQTIGVLFDPENQHVAAERAELQAAVAAGKQTVFIVNSGPSDALDEAMTAFVEHDVDAAIITDDPIFTNRREQLTRLAVRLRIPTIFSISTFVKGGGLLSYGTDLGEVYRLAGQYAGRILNGDKPAELPVQQPTKFQLTINLKTARALGITVPPTLLARADEVIE